jgi:hypothetical protein
MMRSDVIPPVGAQVNVRRRQGSNDDLVPAEVVGHLSDAALGDVLELRLVGSGSVLQRLWPSPTIDLPPAA